MTCIVGLVDNGQVWIGGDSLEIDGLAVTVRKDPKVFKVGEFLIGYAISFRMGQLLRYELHEHLRCTEETDPHRYMVTEFIPAARHVFERGGYAIENSGHFLVGYCGHLYHVEPDCQVGESIDGYDAVGCGSDLALGSLYTTDQYRDGSNLELGTMYKIGEPRLNPSTRIRIALEAAEHGSAGVRRPFVIEKN